MELKSEINKRGKLAREFLYKKCDEIIFPNIPLREASIHYLNGGGKGFRPAMLQLMCGALGGNENQAIPLAAAIEAVHVSSLIHDDWMDNDTTRRGLVSVWKKWTPTIAILAGDAMVGLAFGIAGEIDGINNEMRYKLTQELATIYTKLCHGQMLDIGFETTDIKELDIEKINEMQYLKTGVLFEFSCVAGARLALNKIDDPLIDLVREYAKLVGTAFQIQDDILGLFANEEELGKPVGSDIKEGKRTLLAVHAYIHANEEQRKILDKTLGNHNATLDEINHCVNIMKEIGSVEYTQKLAKDMALKAVEITKKLPDNENTKLLKEFAFYMINRTF